MAHQEFCMVSPEFSRREFLYGVPGTTLTLLVYYLCNHVLDAIMRRVYTWDGVW